MSGLFLKRFEKPGVFCNSVRSYLCIERDAPRGNFCFSAARRGCDQGSRRNDERRAAEKQKSWFWRAASIDRQLLTELRERLNAGARIVGFGLKGMDPAKTGPYGVSARLSPA